MPDHDARGGTLILGGGFAGSYVARYLGKRGAAIVSPDNSMLYVWTAGVRAHPLLPGLGLPVEEREVATLGRHKGIANVLGSRFRGFPGWWITRTYHLYQLPLISRKLRVVADWTVALFFRRDIAQLGTLGHPERVGDG